MSTEPLLRSHPTPDAVAALAGSSPPIPPESLKRLEALAAATTDEAATAPPMDWIGRRAVMKGYVTLEELEDALSEQRRVRDAGESHQPLGQILLRRGLVDGPTVDLLLSEQRFDREPLRFKRYEFHDRLGEGALALVYRAIDRELGREVAVKVVKEATLSVDARARERLRREAVVLARLSHPHVIAIYDSGEEDGRFYVVMELVRGKSLSQLLAERRLAAPAAAELLERVARGVAHAHRHGIIHRDLKPGNILIAESGEPKVADFGLAHLADSDQALTRTGSIQGTPLYMAPEQVSGRSREISPLADVHALGAILYETLTGRPPFAGDSVPQLFASILCDAPVPPRKLDRTVPVDLETIALRALEKEPARRYPSAEAFAEDLRRALAGEPILARPRGWASGLFRKLRKYRTGFGLSAAAVLLTAGALAVGVRAAARARHAHADREAALQSVRELAVTSVDAALQFRRVGSNDQMHRFLPALESACGRAQEQAPNRPEIDFLMGRMYRAFMRDGAALACQERAVVKDPEYAPALYERTVLLSKRYGQEVRKAEGFLRCLTEAPASARAARDVPAPGIVEAERSRPDLPELRRRILDDCILLDRLVRRAEVRPGPFAVSSANTLAARGILAYHRRDYSGARGFLLEAVALDPLLEEAWEILAAAVLRSSAPGSELETWREAEALYTEGLARDRGYLPHLIGRGEVRYLRGDWKRNRGKDPRKEFAAAEEDFTDALKLERSSQALAARGMVRLRRGIWRMSRGDDPDVDYAAAEEDLNQAVNMADSARVACRERGLLRVNRAVWRLSCLEDPGEDLARAEEDYLYCIRTFGGDSGFWNGLALARQYRGMYLTSLGQDPREEFARAEANATEALRLNRSHGNAWRNRGHVRALRGLWEAGGAGNPSADFDGAEEDLAESIRLSGDTASALAYRAKARMGRGIWRIGRGEDGREDLEAGEADFGRAFELNPAKVDPLVDRGLLRLRAAAVLAGRGERLRAERLEAGAAEDFEKALRLNTRLERRLRGLKGVRGADGSR